MVDTAALAVLLGMGDPLPLLARSASSGDWTITAAVIKRASQLQSERRGEELSKLAEAIGNQVGHAIARMFG